MGDQSSHTTAYTGSQPDLDFVDKSSLRYFIPSATDFAPDQLFKDSGLPFGQFLESIAQRDSLFFGELSLDLLLVLFSPRSYTDPR